MSESADKSYIHFYEEEDVPGINKLAQMNHTQNKLIIDRLEQLKAQNKEGFKALEKATLSLDPGNAPGPPGAWRKVPSESYSGRYPLAEWGPSLIAKKLDIV